MFNRILLTIMGPKVVKSQVRYEFTWKSERELAILINQASGNDSIYAGVDPEVLRRVLPILEANVGGGSGYLSFTMPPPHERDIG
jgi:hypothetical protein